MAFPLTGLVAYYKFDANNSNDYTSNGYNGSDTSISYGSTQGKINNGASYNGTSSKITVPIGIYGMFAGTAAYSVGLWWQSAGNGGQVFSNHDNSGNSSDNHESFELYVQPGSGGFFVRGDGSARDEIDFSTTFSTNTWYYIVATYDGSNMKLYVNGSSDATAVASTRTAVTADGGWIGTYDFFRGTGGWYSGYMDEIGWWNIALTSGQVSTLYNGGAGLQPPPLRMETFSHSSHEKLPKNSTSPNSYSGTN